MDGGRRPVHTFNSRLPTSEGAAAFPRHELYISGVIFVLIALALYFYGGAWGVFLLWCLSLVFVLPQGMAATILFEGAGAERAKGRRGVGAAYFACGVSWVLLWLAGSGYCIYRTYLAFKALP